MKYTYTLLEKQLKSVVKCLKLEMSLMTDGNWFQRLQSMYENDFHLNRFFFLFLLNLVL